jgi:hypothetical protein
MKTLFTNPLRLTLLVATIAIVAGGGLVAVKSFSATPAIGLASTTCSNGSFCVTSSTSPVLYPGAKASSLPLTLSNYTSVGLAVSSVSVSFTNSFPSRCATSAFQVNGIAASGTTPSVTINLPSSQWIVIPPGSGSTPGTATFPATLALADNHLDQTPCHGLALTLAYSANAYYYIPTTTLLTASPNPTTYGQTVTMTAAVSPKITPSSVSATPVGTVSFSSCSDAACSSPVSRGTAPVNSSTGVASLTTSFTPTGTYYLIATYNPGCVNAGCSSSTPDFVASPSNEVTETVNYTSCVSTLAAGNLTINSGQDICITGSGTQAGNITVNSGGRLDLLGGKITGNITVNSGGLLNVTGGTVAGNVNSTGAGLFNVCGATISGNLSPTSSSSLVRIGGSSGCAGISVLGNISLTSNTAGEIVGNSSALGGLSVTGTTVGSTGNLNTITANKITGGLSCTSNVPAPINASVANQVTGKRSGQCAAANF